MTAVVARRLDRDEGRSCAYRYHLLRVATDRYQCDPAHLDPQERPRAEHEAAQSLALEELVLGSVEAAGVVISDADIDTGLAMIAKRYAEASEMDDDLARNGLDTPALRACLQREMVFDAVMRRVGARHAPVTDSEVEAFYQRGPERFLRPEQRTVRHILITINERFAENERRVAKARAEELAETLQKEPEAFAELARTHSECPTALEGGRLGTVRRGRLYPQLDAVLFAQREGSVSAPVETELGLHILFCERVIPARTQSLDQARERIRAALTERRQRAAQQAWIAELRRAAAGQAAPVTG